MMLNKILRNSPLSGNGQFSSFAYNLFRYNRRPVRGPDPVESPRLTPQMVTSILQRNEVSAKNTGGVVKDVHCNNLQANKPTEDRRAEGKLKGTDKYLFGVFDGHAGCACAQNLKDRLFEYVAVSLADPDHLYALSGQGMEAARQLIDNLPTTRRDDVSADLESMHWDSLLAYINDNLDMFEAGTNVAARLKSAFLRLDQDTSAEAMCHFSDKSLSSDAINIAFSGAVGIVAYLDGLDLYVANVGDCQAVLGTHVPDTNSWEATLLSNKHDADNDDEVQRLFQRHPNESGNILKGGRLFGQLMPLRAFGDVRYKWSEKDFLHLKKQLESEAHPDLEFLKHVTLPPKYHTPPYLDANPEIIHHRLTPRDSFLVIASDGLWDSEGLRPEDVVSLVGNHSQGHQTLRHYQPKEGISLKILNEKLSRRKDNLAKRTLDDNSATHLIRHALGQEHGHLSAQLTLPEPIVRFYRDDITVTVIYFDRHFIKSYGNTHR